MNGWGDQSSLEMAQRIVEWGGCGFLNKDGREDSKVLDLLTMSAVGLGQRGQGFTTTPFEDEQHQTHSFKSTADASRMILRHDVCVCVLLPEW